VIAGMVGWIIAIDDIKHVMQAKRSSKINSKPKIASKREHIMVRSGNDEYK
jgi:hypothetical protein